MCIPAGGFRDLKCRVLSWSSFSCWNGLSKGSGCWNVCLLNWNPASSFGPLTCSSTLGVRRAGLQKFLWSLLGFSQSSCDDFSCFSPFGHFFFQARTKQIFLGLRKVAFVERAEVWAKFFQYLLSTPGSHVTTVIAFLNRNKALEMQSWTNSADSESAFAKCPQAIAKEPDTSRRRSCDFFIDLSWGLHWGTKSPRYASGLGVKTQSTFGRWKSFTIARRSKAESSFENINGSRAESSSDACQRPDDEENSTSWTRGPRIPWIVLNFNS